MLRGRSANRDPGAAAAAFLSGTVTLGQYGERGYRDGTDWEGAEESRSMLRLLHGHFIVTDLTSVFQKTSEAIHLEAAYDHVQ